MLIKHNLGEFDRVFSIEMRSLASFFTALPLLLCGLAGPPPATAQASSSVVDPLSMNPFYRESPLPFHLPPFDRIKNADYVPAFERGMADWLKEANAISDNPQAPTFDNTIVALERSGRLLNRVSAAFSNLNDADTNPEMQQIEIEMTPKLSVNADAVHLNGKLFARIRDLHERRERLGLDPESSWLLDRYYKDFVRAGANLNDADKGRLKSLNERIAALETAFSQNLRNERNASSVFVTDRAELAGLSDSEIAAAAAKADRKDGGYAIPLLNTTGQPPLAELQDRALRQRIMEASLARGVRGGPYDNRATVAGLARLRAERARLLGYASHAAYKLADQTAHDVGTVNKLLADLAKPAVANARREAADMQAVVDREHRGFSIASWDWDYYSEKVRRERYAFDESQLKPYFELDRVLQDGVFFAAHELYGLTFKERHDLPGYEPDVRVFEVYDADGSPLALFLADYYARPSKQGGAWMNEYVSQSGLFGDKPVVANHANIAKPPPGQPTLLTFDEVVTLFHEFGHGLHGMFSHVTYPRFAGTSVPQDFVEYPSQVNEMWAVFPDVLKNYARHYQTGAPMPVELANKIIATRKFNQGYAVTEYLAASLLDQAWYQLTPEQVPEPRDVVAFEAAALHRDGIDFAPVPPRYRSAYFSHAFTGYDAGYYSYIWAEVLVADSIEWFKAHGGLTRENGERFRRLLLSRGGSDDVMKFFREFNGGNPELAPLLRRRGLDQAPAE